MNRSVLCMLSSALIATSAQVSQAGDAGGAFLGGLVGSVIGNAISNQQQQQQRRIVVQQPQRVVRQAPVVNTYQREENRQVQTALNYFGFNAGTPDGVLGRNSRNAIGEYQAFLGYPPVGVLNEYERAFLTSSYQRAIVGGQQTATLIATSPQGVRGLLLAYRQEQTGAAPVVAAVPVPVAPLPVAPVPVVVPAPVPPTLDVVVPEPTPPAAEPAPVAVAAEAPAPSGQLPSFLAGPAGLSMGSFCNRINLSTNTNGGFVTLATMTDPTQALGEQFCLARTYAVEQGDSLAGTVQGFSMAEIEEQCAAFAPSMAAYQARLVTQDPGAATAALQDFVVGIGAAPAQLSANARICLAVGYRTDNAELALASAMMLVGLGEAAYGELLGHHLNNGFAVTKRPDRGLEWLDITTTALASGASPLVAAGAEARLGLLNQAVQVLSGSAPAPVLQDAAAPADSQGFVLPVPQAQSN